MEKTIRNQRVVIALLAVLLVYNFFALSKLDSRLDDINFNVNNKLQQIESDMKSLRYDVQNINSTIEDDIGLITSFDFSYGELNKDKFTVPVKSKIVPKNYTEETALYLEFSGRTVEMKKDSASSAFIAEFDVGLFEQKDESNIRLVIREGEFSETVELDWSFVNLHTDFLPSALVHLIFDDITYDEKTGVKIDGQLSSFIDAEDVGRLSDLRLIYIINGKTVAEETVDIENIDFYDIVKTFPGYGAGDSFELFAEVTDEFGFIHEMLLTAVELSDDDVIIEEEAVPVDKGYEIIKDKDGNVLCS